MLIDLGIACTWIAMSAAGALGLSSIARDAVSGESITREGDATCSSAEAHEQRYPLEAHERPWGAPA